MSATAWVRFQHKDSAGFGTLRDAQISVFDGYMFASAKATGFTLALNGVALLTPVLPGKLLALWNNFGQTFTPARLMILVNVVRKFVLLSRYRLMT